MKEKLIDHYKSSSEKSEKAFFRFVIFGALFVLVETNSIGKLQLFGSSIENPQAFLWVLALFLAFQFHSSVLFACQSEIFFWGLRNLDYKKKNKDRTSEINQSEILRLLTPTTVIRLAASSIFQGKTLKAMEGDEMWGLSLSGYFLQLALQYFLVGPFSFFLLSTKAGGLSELV